MDTQVLIVGAGPTGLTLAIDLGCAACACTLDRAEGSAGVPAQDGALQRAHHGNLPAHGPRRAGARTPGCRRTARWTSSSCSRWSSRRCCTTRIRRWREAGAHRQVHATARCRSSPISSSRNTRWNRCLKSIAETTAVGHGALRPRIPVVHARRRAASPRRCRTSAARRREIIAQITSSAATAAPARCAAARHRSCTARPAAAALSGAVLLRRTFRPHPDRQGARTTTSPMTARRT